MASSPKLAERFCIHRISHATASDPNVVLAADEKSCPACSRSQTRFRIAEIEAEFDRSLLQHRQKGEALQQEYDALYADVQTGVHQRRLQEILAQHGNIAAESSVLNMRKRAKTLGEEKAFEKRWDLKFRS